MNECLSLYKTPVIRKCKIDFWLSCSPFLVNDPFNEDIKDSFYTLDGQMAYFRINNKTFSTNQKDKAFKY